MMAQAISPNVHMGNVGTIMTPGFCLIKSRILWALGNEPEAGCFSLSLFEINKNKQMNKKNLNLFFF